MLDVGNGEGEILPKEAKDVIADKDAEENLAADREWVGSFRSGGSGSAFGAG